MLQTKVGIWQLLSAPSAPAIAGTVILLKPQMMSPTVDDRPVSSARASVFGAKLSRRRERCRAR